MSDTVADRFEKEAAFDEKNDAEITRAAERLILCIEHLAVEEGDVDPEAIYALYKGDVGEPMPKNLATLSRLFGLDAFEGRVLLLCLVANVDSEFSGLAREVQGLDYRQPPITVSLALSLFPDGGHDHFLRGSRLLRHKFIRLDGDTLYEAAVIIDAVMISYLITGNCDDPSIAGLVSPYLIDMGLSDSQEKIADAAAVCLKDDTNSQSVKIIQLAGYDRIALRVVARHAASGLECGVHLTSFFQIPSDPIVLADIAMRWRRKAVLTRQILVVDASGVSPKDRDFEAACYLLQQFIALAGVPVIILAEDRINFHLEECRVFDVPPPDRDELAALWHQVLYRHRCLLMAAYFSDEDTILVDDEEDRLFGEELAACFAFSVSDIQGVVDTLYHTLGSVDQEVQQPLTLPFDWRGFWWQAARLQARPSFDGLARRIEAQAGFDTLVTNAETSGVLSEIIAQFKARPLVRGLWGLEPAFQRGTGITVLFAGSSGTGKTLAAEAVAKELSLDLYQIDLSQMVSKYIGETQKNLGRVFEAAERGGSVLLFDEADALFSKRTEVKDSKDRHANMEVGYLLQRMEAYSGIAILTSNLKESIDDAFLRRLQYVVDFPFPTQDMRAKLWQTMLPTRATMGDLPAPEVFARLTLTGAQIRNVIRRAAYRAASGSGQMEIDHILHAAQAEMEKSDRALSLADLRRLLEC